MKVEIQPDRITAKELNPLGKEPNHLGYKDKNKWGEMVFATESAKWKYAEDWEQWQQAESERKVYSIESMASPFIDGKDYDKCDLPFALMHLKPGSIHEATIIPGTDKIRIL